MHNHINRIEPHQQNADAVRMIEGVTYAVMTGRIEGQKAPEQEMVGETLVAQMTRANKEHEMVDDMNNRQLDKQIAADNRNEGNRTIKTTKENSVTMVAATTDKGKTIRGIVRDKALVLETRDRVASAHDRVHQDQSHATMMVPLAPTTQEIEGVETTKNRDRSHSNPHLEILMDTARELISEIEKPT